MRKSDTRAGTVKILKTVNNQCFDRVAHFVGGPARARSGKLFCQPVDSFPQSYPQNLWVVPDLF
jgi:hypothetical protein